MKKLLLILPLLSIFMSGSGQEAVTYSARAEYGLYGKVKEMTTYICKAGDGKVPRDTAAWTGKTVVSFDEKGNVLRVHKIRKIEHSGTAEYKMTFTGMGRKISFRDSTSLPGSKAEENSYKYVWTDNYNYSIVPVKQRDFLANITLDKNYRLLKSVIKQHGAGWVEDVQTVYKGKRIKNIIINTVHKDWHELRVQVVKAYDEYANPTIMYVYLDKSEGKVEEVVYKTYKYF